MMPGRAVWDHAGDNRLPRFDHLEGIGRVRVYDNGGKTADRYTVLFEDIDHENDTGFMPGYPRLNGLGLSENPNHPQGVSQWCVAEDGPHLGKQIDFLALPENVQQHVIDRMKEDQ